MNLDNPSADRKSDDVAMSPSLPEAPLQGGSNDSNDRHFQTDHLRINLKRRTISSGFVTMVSQAAQFGLSLVSTVILAHLLLPHDFGLLAMVTSIMGLLRIFKDAGLSSATIQHEGINHAQVSNLFWINVGIGGIMVLILAISAPAIAWFYREPQLIPISLWLSITFLLSGSTVQHQALLTRQMRFGALAVIQIGSSAIGLAAAVAMALLGCSYWSLVGMNLAMEGAGFLLTWSASSWRPQLPKRHSGTRPLLDFGVNMTAGSALYILSSSADSILIGRFYGAASVGLYSRAMALLMRPLNQLLAPIGSVFIPTFSRLQNEPERYRRAFLQMHEAVALASFAITAALIPLSRPITLVLLGPKWEPAVPIFGSLGISALYFPVVAAAGWLFISQGRGRDFLVMNSIYAALTIGSFVAGLPFGPVGVALSFSVSGLVVRLPVVYHLAGRLGPVTARDMWTGFFRQLAVWTRRRLRHVFDACFHCQIFAAGSVIGLRPSRRGRCRRKRIAFYASTKARLPSAGVNSRDVCGVTQCRTSTRPQDAFSLGGIGSEHRSNGYRVCAPFLALQRICCQSVESMGAGQSWAWSRESARLRQNR